MLASNLGVEAMKWISTRTHGVLDYSMAVLMLALPWLFTWSDATKMLLTILAIGIVLYSLLTRYEMGAMRVLPMRAHLALDMVGGIVLLVAALMMSGEMDGVRWTLGVLGVAELGAAMMTDPDTNTVPAADSGRGRAPLGGV